MAHIIANLIVGALAITAIVVIWISIKPKRHRIKTVLWDSDLIPSRRHCLDTIEYTVCGLLIIAATIFYIAC